LPDREPRKPRVDPLAGFSNIHLPVPS
jgi:hypothetical protein